MRGSLFTLCLTVSPAIPHSLRPINRAEMATAVSRSGIDAKPDVDTSARLTPAIIALTIAIPGFRLVYRTLGGCKCHGVSFLIRVAVLFFHAAPHGTANFRWLDSGKKFSKIKTDTLWGICCSYPCTKGLHA
jgi:hypothetical protein